MPWFFGPEACGILVLTSDRTGNPALEGTVLTTRPPHAPVSKEHTGI